MKKIFKKSLAIMVSAAICLTALIGCLSVSAANGEAPVYTVVSAEGKNGETVGVNVTGADLTKICGQSVNIIFAAGLEIVKVYDNDEKRDLVLVNDETGGEYNILSNENGTKTVRLVDIINFPEYGEGESYNPPLVTSSFNVTISVKIPANAAAGTEYPITFDESQFADLNEKWVYPTLNGGEITVVEDAPVCTHENLEFVSAVPATEEANGTITFECADCGEQQVVTVSYYANYRISSTAADYASEISLVFNARNDRLAEQGDYTDAFIYFEHVLASDSSTKITTKNISEAKDTVTGSSSRPSKTWYYGIKSTQLTENVSAYVFVNVNGSWYNGLITNYSVRTYADARLPLANDTEKKLIVNMLTYGSKMQQFKNYNVENLADANLGEYAQYVTTEDPVIADEKIDNHQETDVYINKYQLDMASKIEAVMYFRSDRYTGENKSDYTVVATWTNANGVELSQTYKTVADGDIKAYTPELQNGEPRENRYTFRFDNLASYDLRQPVTFYIYDGDLEVSHGYTASLEALINSGISSSAWAEEEVAVYKAMLNYCDASYAYFVG